MYKVLETKDNGDEIIEFVAGNKRNVHLIGRRLVKVKDKQHYKGLDKNDSIEKKFIRGLDNGV